MLLERKKIVKAAAARLSAPGLGMDCGSTPGDIMRAFFHGLFLSPQMVGEAIKGSFLIAEVMAMKGYKVQPLPRVPHHDTVQAVQLGNHECLLAFCEAVQTSSPVGSFTKSIAGATPGYASEVGVVKSVKKEESNGNGPEENDLEEKLEEGELEEVVKGEEDDEGE